MIRILALAAVLALGACTSVPLTVDQEMRLACRSFTATLRALTPIKPTLTVSQVARVDKVVDEVQPLCKAAADNPAIATTAILDRVQRALVTMAQAEDRRL
jgi:hypothetical protein